MNLRNFSIALLALGAISFVSCSDDDKNNPELPNNVPSGVMPKPNDVFTAGVPTSYNGATITTNSQGLVSSIRNNTTNVMVEFQYGNISRAETYDAKMTVNAPYETYSVYMNFNHLGYVKYAVEYDDDNDMDVWYFEYDNDGHMVKMARSEGDETTLLSYENGDVVKVSESDLDGDRSQSDISYTDATVTSPIENKGGIMLFDDTFDVDLDEMSYAYYAGLLGKATRHLPVRCQEIPEPGDAVEYSTFTWSFNANGLPVSMVETEYHGTWSNAMRPVTFGW